jgi:acyl-CoA thioesterase
MEDNNFPDLLKTKAKNEPYVKFLNLEIIDVKEGYAKVKGKVNKNMLNLHGITHGGFLFSIIDEAFELASNSHGTAAVALNMNITYFLPTFNGDTIFVEAEEINRTKRTATYNIKALCNDKLIASCQALVYRKKDKLFE